MEKRASGWTGPDREVFAFQQCQRREQQGIVRHGGQKLRYQYRDHSARPQ
jgi:hypothetical protein